MYILEPLDLDVIVAIQFGIYTEIRTPSVSLFHIIFNGDHLQRLELADTELFTNRNAKYGSTLKVS